jgi:hypothetical protein
MSVFIFCAAVCILGFLIIFAFFLCWVLYIHVSPFHVIANRIPGPKFHLPILGNSLELTGGLDSKGQLILT